MAPKRNNMVAVAVVVAACILAAAPRMDAAVTCSQVTNWLTPCISYVAYGGSVAPACCYGVKSLSAASTTTGDRRTACGCIKDGLSAIPGINYDLVAKLPEKCGVTVPYKITPSTDCSKVK